MKHKLIAEQQVHNNVSNLGLLTETAGAVRQNLDVDWIDAVADKGYFKIEDIQASEAAGIVPYVPKPKRGFGCQQWLLRQGRLSLRRRERRVYLPWRSAAGHPQEPQNLRRRADRRHHSRRLQGMQPAVAVHQTQVPSNHPL